MNDPERELTSASTRPLCRRYALAIAAVTSVRVRVGGRGQAHPLFWVFGWLPDGECEPLGLCIGARALPRMLAGLKRRGLERLGRIQPLEIEGAESVEPALSAMAEAFPQARASSTHDASPTALAVANEVSETVIRAVRRHRLFESEAQALDVVARAMQRAERRLDGERRLAA